MGLFVREANVVYIMSILISYLLCSFIYEKGRNNVRRYLYDWFRERRG